MGCLFFRWQLVWLRNRGPSLILVLTSESSRLRLSDSSRKFLSHCKETLQRLIRY